MVRLVFERGDAGGEDGDQPLLGFDGLLQVVELVQQLFQDQRQVLDPLRLWVAAGGQAGWCWTREVAFQGWGCWWWSWLEVAAGAAGSVGAAVVVVPGVAFVVGEVGEESFRRRRRRHQAVVVCRR